MNVKIGMKARLVFLGAVMLVGSPLCLRTRAADKTEKPVAFRTGDNRYVTAVAGGGLNTSGAEISTNQTYVLIDLNGGEVADGDSVQIKWAPAGTKPTYWHEGDAVVNRIGGKPDAACTFKIMLKEKSDKAAPKSVVLQTASGKFVSVPSKGAALATVQTQDNATTLDIVETAQDAGTAPAATTAATVPTTSTPATSTPAPTTATGKPPTTPTPASTEVKPTLQKTEWKFDFGSGQLAPGYTQVLPTSAYSNETGFGLEPGATVTAQDRAKPDALKRDFLTSDKPFVFSAGVPEGNYNVTVTLGDQSGESNTTVKAEQRRLALENVATAAGKFETRSFTVNIRTPKIAGGKGVALNSREWGPPIALRWDEKLTLEFNGKKPCVCSVEIKKVGDAITVFLAGDSTVTDQGAEPWAGWGQMLPRFFRSGVAIANHAESGLSLGSFKGQRRLEKILSALKDGDYVFIQFGHNDQKDKGENAGPFKNYKDNLKDFVTKITAKGGLPVVVTPMERRRWSGGKPQPTLTDYAGAARQVAKEEGVPVIDLNAMSLKFYEAIGAENSKKAFVHYAAGTFPGQTEALKDDTHFNNYGGYELARCMVEGIKVNVPALAKLLADDAGTFDPSKPDSVETFSVPASPFAASEKPAGS
jgi:lysophospholipase L1-like esterase